jgi:small subunit ribosomal protein S18
MAEDREYSGGRSSGRSFGGGGRGGDRDRGDKDGKRKPKRSMGGFRKKRPPVTMKFDYKNVYDLVPFLTEEGKIIPARVSGLNAGQQRQLTAAVKRARNVAFISAIGRDTIH